MFICPECKSDEIRADASTRVNHDFEIADVYDGWVCNDCEYDGSDFDEVSESTQEEPDSTSRTLIVQFSDHDEHFGVLHATLIDPDDRNAPPIAEGDGYSQLDAFLNLLHKLDSKDFDNVHEIVLTL